MSDDRPNALCADAPFGSYRNQVTMTPPASLRIRGPVGIDLCLASEVAGLWARGIRTVASCCGHGDPGMANIVVDPADASTMEALGYRRDEQGPGLHAYTPKTGCATP